VPYLLLVGHFKLYEGLAFVTCFHSGYYSPASSSVLYVCPSHSNSSSGATTCTCSPNWYPIGSGTSLTCSPYPYCLAGSFVSLASASGCELCPKGTYSPQNNASSCTPVPAGSECRSLEFMHFHLTDYICEGYFQPTLGASSYSLSCDFVLFTGAASCPSGLDCTAPILHKKNPFIFLCFLLRVDVFFRWSCWNPRIC
jgi:hypothetical protein